MESRSGTSQINYHIYTFGKYSTFKSVIIKGIPEHITITLHFISGTEKINYLSACLLFVSNGLVRDEKKEKGTISKTKVKFVLYTLLSYLVSLFRVLLST